jgi:hypothetical protein
VQAVCGGATSAYVNGANFTTSVPAGCTDTYEANETHATARLVSPGTYLAKICSATDRDWYKFTTPAGQPKVRITLGTLPLDYDVELYSSTNSTTPIASSTNGGTTSETINYNAGTGVATYYVRVFGYNNVFHTTSQYTLGIFTSATNFTRQGGPVQHVAKDAITVTEDHMEVWPNPASQNLFVNYLTNMESTGTLTLMDLAGHMVMKREMVLNTGANTIDLNISELADGMYVVRMQTPTAVLNAKVQVMR